MEINAFNMRALCDEINTALAAIGAKHGLTLHAGGGTFDATQATMRLKVTPTAGESLTIARQAAEAQFKQMASYVGADPTWYGREIKLKGMTYTVTGLAPGRSKNCIKITRYDGKGFVCPPSTVRASLVGKL